MLNTEVIIIENIIRAERARNNAVIRKIKAITILVLSSATAFEGFNLLIHEIMQSETDAIIAGAKTKRVDPAEIEAQISKLGQLDSMPATTGWTRKMIGNLLDGGPFGTARVEENVSEILKVEPASGMEWLKLARLRAKDAGSNQRTLSAVTMSELTEPREIDVMAQRIAFYLQIWEVLPEARQRRALNELTDAAPVLVGEAIQRIKSVIEKKDPSWRRAIKEKLIGLVVGERRWMKDIGL
jgi:hypothetical protein